MKNILLLIACVAFSGCSSTDTKTPQSQSHTYKSQAKLMPEYIQMSMEMFSSIDADENGIINSREAKEHHKGMFYIMDEDNDSQLNYTEFMSVKMDNNQQSMKSNKFMILDDNKDNMVSYSEFMRGTARYFGTMDVDRNRKITLEEFVNGQQ